MSYYNYPGALSSMGRWIADQKKSRNIVYVVQTGDAVDEGWIPKQWENFDQLYHGFQDILPYFPIAGNHDVGMQWHGYGPYLARPYVKGFPRGNSFEGGRAVFATFSAGGTDFLLLGAGWESEVESVAWMNDVLRQYPDDTAILLFHGYINADGTFTKVGQQMFDRVVAPNPNVRLVLCGHVRGTGYRSDDLDDTGDGAPDRRVNTMLCNYQHYDQNCGQLRVLTFDPVSRSIEVMTYSPYSDYLFEDDYFKASTFKLEHAF
ncbi:MAG: metallophosphoesterase [Christensenella sp.]